MNVDLKYPGISCIGISFPLTPDARSAFHSLLPDHLLNSPEHRKDEYIAGRYCAIKAAAQIGHSIHHLPSSPTREPIWPEGLVGSISHSKSMAISCTAPASEYLSVGIDTETIIDSDTIQAIKHVIALPSDANYLDKELKDVEHRFKYTLLFSMKESLYKAIYPLKKEFIDFKEVCLKHLSIEDQTFELQYQESSFKGKFLVSDQSVITVLPLMNS